MDLSLPRPLVASSLQPPKVSVRRSTRRKRTITAYRERDTIVVLVPQRMSKHAEALVVDTMVQKVLAKEARSTSPRGNADLTSRAVELAWRYLTPVLGQSVEPAAVLWVGNQQRRWGSCTPSSGVIRLSDRLKPLPSWVVDYVLLHEMAHLVDASHSADFWRLVDRYPQAERAKGFLEGYQLGVSQPQPDPDNGG